jgi:two-component system, OmpR family, sensor kinase
LLARSRTDLGALTLTPLRGRDAAAAALEVTAMDPTLLVATTEADGIEVDVTLLQRALVNLLENARKHAGGVVQLAIGREGEFVSFAVDDVGAGFPSGLAARLHEPLGSPAGSAANAFGSGLGLGLVARIAKAHGGELRLTQGGGGGRAVLLLPHAVRAGAAANL